MSPYALLAGLAGELVLLAGVGLWQHGAGADEQKAVDQVQFDAINGKLAQQKADAARMLQDGQARIIALQGERDALKTNLEKQYAIDQANTRALAAQYAGRELRYGAGQGSGCGPGGAGAVPAGADGSGAAGAAIVQLPEPIAADLRQLALEADELRDAYAKCYAWAAQVK